MKSFRRFIFLFLFLTLKAEAFYVPNALDQWIEFLTRSVHMIYPINANNAAQFLEPTVFPNPEKISKAIFDVIYFQVFSKPQTSQLPPLSEDPENYEAFLFLFYGDSEFPNHKAIQNFLSNQKANAKDILWIKTVLLGSKQNAFIQWIMSKLLLHAPITCAGCYFRMQKDLQEAATLGKPLQDFIIEDFDATVADRNTTLPAQQIYSEEELNTLIQAQGPFFETGAALDPLIIDSNATYVDESELFLDFTRLILTNRKKTPRYIQKNIYKDPLDLEPESIGTAVVRNFCWPKKASQRKFIFEQIYSPLRKGGVFYLLVNDPRWTTPTDQVSYLESELVYFYADAFARNVGFEKSKTVLSPTNFGFAFEK